MKFHLLLKFVLLTAAGCVSLRENVSAQATKGSGAPAASSGTGSSVTGYSYHLPRHYHIKYKSVKTVVIDKNPRNITVNCYSYNISTTTSCNAWKWPGDPAAANTALPQIVLNPVVKFNAYPKLNLPLVQKDKLYFGTINTVPVVTTVCKCLCPACVPNTADMSKPLYTNTVTVTVDTLDRYDQARRQLTAAVTQGDSGRLVLAFKKNDFPALNNPLSVADLDYRRYLPTGEIRIATPITSSDSASNFYLQINNRATAGQRTSYISLAYGAVQYGAVVIPYKYRFRNNRPTGGGLLANTKLDTTVSSRNNSESTQAFNVAVFIGKQWGRTQFFYDASKTHNTVGFMLAAFAGPSLITLNANNVNRFTNLNNYPASQIAFSTGGSASVQWRSFNFGLFYGWDIPVERSPWIYRYKGWMGFGIGYSLGMFTNSNSQQQIGN